MIGSGSKWGSSARRPRIGIDLHVVDGIFQGSRTHCLELFSRVIEIVPECDFFAFAAETERLLSFSPGFSQPNVTLFPMPEKSSSVRLLWQLPQIARKCELSLLHTQYIVPPTLSCASAVTVHDILFESHPEYFEKLFVHRSRLLVRSSVRKSSAVFTVSDFSRQQLCQTYAVADQKVHTIPNGVDCARFFPGDAGNDAVTSLGLRRGEYFLTVGRLEPRKNHANLLRAWAMLKIPRPLLVMIGQRHFGYDEVLNLIQSLRLESDVRILETVSDTLLPSLYRAAKGFVYCSWAEGFGMPVLEAMASGVPVISSLNTALPEVCADAALLVDPGKPAQIADAIMNLDQQPKMRNELVRRGLIRAKDFTWEKAAQTVRRVYLDLFGLPPDRLESQSRDEAPHE